MPRTITETIGSMLLFGAAVLLLGGTAGAGTGSTTTISTKKLIIKDYEGKPLLVKFISKDPGIDPDLLNVPVNGLEMRVADIDEGNEGFSTMEAAGWTQKGTKPKFVFKDPGGSDVVHKAKLSPGKLKVISKGFIGFGIIDPSGVGNARVVFSAGVNDLCARTPGMDGTNKKDDFEKGIYVAVNAEAPSSCPSIVD